MKNEFRKIFFAKWQSQVKKGVLEYIILQILKRKSYYGYELIQDIQKYTKMKLAEGTIYPLLNRLKSEGFVNSKWVEMEEGIPRKYYEITNEGHLCILEMKEYMQNLNSSIQKLAK
jgi:PadR family transcriptional regulator PadR